MALLLALTIDIGSTAWRFMGSYKWVISKVTRIITHIRGLKTPPVTTLNPKPYRSLKGTPLKTL